MKTLKGKRLLLIIGAVLLLGGGAAGYLFLGGRGGDKAAAGREAPGAAVRVGEMTTNLADAGSRRFIQVDVELRVKDGKAAKAVEERMAVVKDAVLQVLRGTAYEDAAGAGGMDRLRGEIRARVNAALGEDLVKDVYFGKFIVQ